MKRYLIFLGTTLLILAAIGGLVVASGIVPVKASSGHWPITAWILHFAMQRSVDTHSRSIEAPLLESGFLVVQGAGYYDVGCYGCHGGPGSPQPSVALGMTPQPPDLLQRVPEYDARELFYIVRHGVKFTGMPAWASEHRDDEVWAMVAFLQRLPEMDRAQYEQLSGRALRIEARAGTRMSQSDEESQDDRPSHSTQDDGERPAAQPPIIVLHRCVLCHGSDGQGRGANPQLAGQKPEYLTAAVHAYRVGERHSGIMQPIAADLSDQEIEEAVTYYSALGSFQAAPPRRPEAIDRGQAIAMVGLPEQHVGSCIDCHGSADPKRARYYPHLAGQHAHYLVQQLHLFRSGDRAGTEHARTMHAVAKSLTDEQIADLAAYYASEPPPSAEPAAQEH